MKVKFISDAYAVTEVGREKLFSKDDVQDLNPHSAERWIRRGLAVKHTSKKRAGKSATAADS